MPRGAAAAACGESANAPDFLSESRRGDENCAAGDGFVPGSASHWNQQAYDRLVLQASVRVTWYYHLDFFHHEGHEGFG